MKGWGRVVFLVSAGIFTFAGCGGRTGVLGDDAYDPDDGGSSGSTGTGGTKATAGKPSKGGKASGGGVGTGGAGPFPVAGASPVGGTGIGGSFPVAGFPSFGGAFPSFGGASPTGGAFPVGGFGGVPSDCQSCIFKTCNAELTQCFQDVGCISIFACAATSGCQGFDCYTPEACAGVIDQWGGFGSPSMKAMLQSFSCVLGSGCPCGN
jgi:hypothetical protein